MPNEFPVTDEVIAHIKYFNELKCPQLCVMLNMKYLIVYNINSCESSCLILALNI